MTPESVGPLSRQVDVRNLPPHGSEIRVEATAEECAALAKDFKLPRIQSLTGDFKLKGTPRRLHVSGRVNAAITQICVVTLEPFDSAVEEEVDVEFAESGGIPAEPPTEIHDYEPPDEIVSGHVDLGALAAEFLVLGLDPYPRKPGSDFSFESGGTEKDSPFAALGKLKGK
jgi:uncharacterized metal-binding protein YceD (DUF177 family)